MDFSRIKLTDLKKMVRKCCSDAEVRLHGSLQKKETWLKAAAKHTDRILTGNPIQRAIQGQNVVAKIRNQRGGVKLEVFNSSGELMVYHSKLLNAIGDVVSELLKLEHEGVKVKVEIKGQKLFKTFNTELETRQRSEKVFKPMKPAAIPKGTRRYKRPSLAGLCATVDNIQIACDMITATGLNVELSNADSQLILLVPSDNAFNVLAPAALNEALSNPEVAKTILLNHVAAIKPSNSSGYCGQICDETITTLGGNQIVVTNDMFITKDITASNGMLHVIDQVLMPESLTRNPGWADMIYESTNSPITANKVEAAKEMFLAKNPMSDESLFSDWAKTEGSEHGKNITFKDWAEEEAEEFAYEGMPSHMKADPYHSAHTEAENRAEGFRDWAESEMDEETHSRQNPQPPWPKYPTPEDRPWGAERCRHCNELFMDDQGRSRMSMMSCRKCPRGKREIVCGNCALETGTHGNFCPEHAHLARNPVGDKYKSHGRAPTWFTDVPDNHGHTASFNLNKDGTLSDYELARAVAVVKGIREQREQNPNWSKMTSSAKTALLSPQARSAAAHGMRSAADKISPKHNPSGSFVEGKWTDRGEAGMFDGQVTIDGVQFAVVFSMEDESRFIMGDGREWEEIQAGSYDDEMFDYEYYEGDIDTINFKTQDEFNAIRKVALDWVNVKIGKTNKQIIGEAYSPRQPKATQIC